jgi:hypothetical protein
MARSLFDHRTFRPRDGFAERYRSDLHMADRPRYATGPRLMFQLPWIFRFAGYFLMAAFGILVAFTAWLLMMVLG